MARRRHRIQQEFPSVKSLRDVASQDQFESVAGLLPAVVARRARHVVSEDERVERCSPRAPAAISRQWENYW